MRKNDEMPFKQWYLRDKQSPFLYKKIRDLRKLKSKKKLYSTLLNIRPMKKVVIMTLMRVCQNDASSFFYKQNPDFHKPGLCHVQKNLYL